MESSADIFTDGGKFVCLSGKEVETGTPAGRWMETDRGKVGILLLYFVFVMPVLPATLTVFVIP